MKKNHSLARVLITASLATAIFLYASALFNAQPLARVNACVPPKIAIDVYTQRGGKGQNVSGGVFEPLENVSLYADVTADGCPAKCKNVTFTVTGPANEYENISFTAFALTNCTGTATTTYQIPLPTEYPIEKVSGLWHAEATLQANEQTFTDMLDFAVINVIPEFPTALATLPLMFILTTTALAAKKKQQKH